MRCLTQSTRPSPSPRKCNISQPWCWNNKSNVPCAKTRQSHVDDADKACRHRVQHTSTMDLHLSGWMTTAGCAHFTSIASIITATSHMQTPLATAMCTAQGFIHQGELQRRLPPRRDVHISLALRAFLPQPARYRRRLPPPCALHTIHQGELQRLPSPRDVHF